MTRRWELDGENRLVGTSFDSQSTYENVGVQSGEGLLAIKTSMTCTILISHSMVAVTSMDLA